MAAPTLAHRRRRAQTRREVTAGLAIGVAGVAVIAVLVWPKRPPVVPPAPPPPAVVVQPPAPPPVPPAPPAEVLTPAHLHGPVSVVAGSPITVWWSGPENPGDFVTLVRADAPDAESGEVQAAQSGPTLEFTAPDEPGEFEFRYLTGRSKTLLGRSNFRVLPLTAEISAPSQAVLGTKITVAWVGPNRPGDHLTIVTPEVSDSVADGSIPVSSVTSPAEITVPVDPGEFEIRYVTGNHQVIGRRSLLITIPVTTLSAPDIVPAGATLQVQWRGPDSPSDVVTLVQRGAPEGQRGISTPTAMGSPLTLRAPVEGGAMELRYVTGSKALTLARRPIDIDEGQ